VREEKEREGERERERELILYLIQRRSKFIKGKDCWNTYKGRR